MVAKARRGYNHPHDGGPSPPGGEGGAGVKGEVVSRKSWSYAGLTAVGLLFYCHTAAAQRANENAVTTADDAFGTRVGNDDVGLYDSRNARGFDPQQAGNMRLEGMYFDQQATFGSRLQRTQSIRVGLTAQSYPFPAPTGIANYLLNIRSALKLRNFITQTTTEFLE